jgi:8-oxo-dGTP pyrophosphatase MutT (NUDIX family)
MKYLKLFEEAEYWGKKGAGILPICKETKRLLVPFRSGYVLEPNTWGVWGGKIDLGEEDEYERTLSVDASVEAAAKREFVEESEYDGEIKLIPAYVYRDCSFAYHNFFGLVDYEFEPVLNWETERFKWMTYEELLALPRKHFGLVALLKNSSKELEALLG